MTFSVLNYIVYTILSAGVNSQVISPFLKLNGGGVRGQIESDRRRCGIQVV